jgi:DNA-binding SARP family transcriptional activator
MGAMAESGVDFGVLGPLQVTVAADPLPLGTPKQRAVLAVLVINRNRPVGIESLITAAWEEWPPPGARASLHTYVSNLRRLLGTEGSDSRTALISKPPGYQLSISDADCNLGRFVTGKTVGCRKPRPAASSKPAATCPRRWPSEDHSPTTSASTPARRCTRCTNGSCVRSGWT